MATSSSHSSHLELLTERSGRVAAARKLTRRAGRDG
jgi:hypothetical protein